MQNISFQELPYESLALIGMTKERILSLDKDNLQRFLSGQRTDLLRFRFYENGKPFALDGKLLLEREEDNSVKAYIVPVRQAIQNDYNLTNTELFKLYTGKLVNKNMDGHRHILQLDRDTNEVLMTKTNGIHIPFTLSPADREKLLQGKTVEVEQENGKRSIRIDLINNKGFSVDGEHVRLKYAGAHFNEIDLQGLELSKYKLTEYEIQRMMDGHKSGLIDFPDGSKGKLELIRNEDKTVSIQTFPVKNELNNDLHLSEQQIEKLKKGETVAAEIGGNMFICQLDKETNDLLHRPMAQVVPDVIREVELKQEDKDKLLNGESISILNKQTGEHLTARIDLNHKQGIEIKDDSSKLKLLYTSGKHANEELDKALPNKIQRDMFLSRNNLDKKDLANTARAAFDERQKFFFDYHNPGVMSFIRTDANRAEFMELFQNPKSVSIKI
jgi:hypothetical protein